MNKFLQRIHHFFGCNLTKNHQADALKTKIMQGKQKDLRELKKTNGIIRIMIESGELRLRVKK